MLKPQAEILFEIRVSTPSATYRVLGIMIVFIPCIIDTALIFDGILFRIFQSFVGMRRYNIWVCLGRVLR